MPGAPDVRCTQVSAIRERARGPFGAAAGSLRNGAVVEGVVVNDEVQLAATRSSGRSALFSRAPVVEAEALTVHFQDMNVMVQSVEQRPGQAVGTEGLGPLVEGKIRDEDRSALIALRDELEQGSTNICGVWIYAGR